MGKFTGLIILDGFGYTKDKRGNAIEASGVPYIRTLFERFPHTLVGASGMDVGLPDGQMGNSEVGHLNIGAGRIVYQELTRITKSINDGDFFENPAFVWAADNAKKGHKLHVMGLVSDGGVHSHNTHLYALLDFAKRQGIKDVYVHCFMDGRDVPPMSGKGFLEELQAKMEELGIGKIATVSGRYYAMDRDNRWDRVQKAYSALVDGEGNSAESVSDMMQASYDVGVTDEFVIPTVITAQGKPVATVDKGDSIIFFNFRPDRAREITRAFIMPEFDSFPRAKGYVAPAYVGFTRYDATFNGWRVAYMPQTLDNTLGEYLAKCGKTQLRIAETEKYAHVTFFFNGGVENANEGEDRVLIKSPSVATYDLKPEMSAYEVTDKAEKLIESGKYDFMVLNFANCDMVGHTGVFEAAKAAVDAVDKCVKRIIEAIDKVGGSALLTADHGNSEKMLDDEGKPWTAHTTNPVPLVLINYNAKLSDGGKLADLAPTLLEMMNLPIPKEMTGRSLLIK